MSSLRNTILDNQQKASVSLCTNSTATKTQCSLSLTSSLKAGNLKSSLGTLVTQAPLKNLTTNQLLTSKVQTTSSNPSSTAGLLKSGKLTSSFTQSTLLNSGNYATSGKSLALLGSQLSSLRTTGASLAPLTSSHATALQLNGHSLVTSVKTGNSSALLTSGNSLLAKYGGISNGSLLASTSGRKRPLQTGMSSSKSAKKCKWEPKVTLLDDFAEATLESDDAVMDNEENVQQIAVASLFGMAVPRPTSTNSTSASNSGVEEANTRLKLALVNAVLGALIGSPSLRSATDPTRCAIIKLVQRVASIDGEFVLKLAVFARRVIGLRAVSNLLVAIAAHDKRIRPSLRKYFRAAVELPSDWLEVVEQYRTFVDPNGTQRRITLPSALRCAMAAKFADFDEYQLAKYNTERNRAKRRAYQAKWGKAKKRQKQTPTKSVPEASETVHSSRSPSHASGESEEKSDAESENEDEAEREDTAESESGDKSESRSSETGSNRSNSGSESASDSGSKSSTESDTFVRPRSVVTTKNRWACLDMDMDDDIMLQQPKASKGRGSKANTAAKPQPAKVAASSGDQGRTGAAKNTATSTSKSGGCETSSAGSTSQRGGRGATSSAVSTSQRGGRGAASSAVSTSQRGGRGAASSAVSMSQRGGRGAASSAVSMSQRGGRGAASSAVSTSQRGGRGAASSAVSTSQRGGRGGRGASSSAISTSQHGKDDTNETAKRSAKPLPKPGIPPFTLKMLVRLLHISQPADLVLGLLGKRYPATMAEFVRMRMDGVFDEARAGQRMRLCTPVTWETQVSAAGSCASTWEQLIDSNKLPFMATLRNLRNLLVAGVSLVHHGRVLSKLTSPHAVRASRQFPFRFLSAFLVLDDLAKRKAKQDNPATKKKPAPRKCVAKSRNARQKQKKPVIYSSSWMNKPLKYNLEMVNRYRTALEKAVQISAMWNLDPIRGCTWIILDYGTLQANKIKQKIGKLEYQSELAVLLSCLAKFCCEKCVLIVMTDDSPLHKQIAFDPTKSENILKDMQTFVEEAEKFRQSQSANKQKLGPVLPQVLTETLFSENESPIDTLMFITSNETVDSTAASKQQQLATFVQRYRLLRNQKLLFVTVDLGATQSKIVDSSVTAGEQTKSRSHPNDINIAGFSDQILRFVATRGNERLLSFIDRIGRALRATEQRKKAGAASKELDESDQEDCVHIFEADQPNQPVAEVAPQQIVLQPKSAWRTVRVFISSTFADMHGERDFISRFIIPQMRERVRSLFVDLVDIDLRWGVRNESQSSAALETCLNEARRADILIALIGERRGWQPPLALYPDFIVDALTDTSKPSLHSAVLGDWSWLAGRSEKQLTPDQRNQMPSITELEIITFINAMNDLAAARKRTFFFLRDPAFLESVPHEHRAAFSTEIAASRAQLAKIKATISASQFEVFTYSCKFAGLFEGRPIVSNLDLFAEQLRTLMWKTISQISSEAAENRMQLSPASTLATDLTRFECMNKIDCFVPRTQDLTSCLATLTDATARLRHIRPGASSLLLLLSGEAGSGRSSFAVNLIQSLIAQRNGTGPVGRDAARNGAKSKPKKIKYGKTDLLLMHFAEGASSLTHDLPSALRRFMSETLKAIELQRGALIAQRVANRLRLDEHEGNDVNWLVETFCKLLAFAMQLFSGVYVLIDDIDRCCSAVPDCITPALFIQRVAETLKAPFGFLVFIVTMCASSTSFRDANTLIVQHGEKLAKLAQSAIVAKQQQNANAALKQKQVVAQINQQQAQSGESKLPNLALTHFRLGAIGANVRADLVKKYFARFGKSLRESLLENEVHIIKSKRDGGNPLYLVTACEELRLVAQFSSIDTQIREIPQTLATLLGRILERLEGEFGSNIVRAAALLVAHSPDGLLEFELRSLLTAALILDRDKHNAALQTDGVANKVQPELYAKAVCVKSAPQYNHRADSKDVETLSEFYQNALNILLQVRRGKRALLSQAGVSRLCYELRQLLSPGSVDSNNRLIIAHRSAREALENRYLQPASATSVGGKDKKTGVESISLHCHALLAAYYDAQLRTIELLGADSVELFRCLLYHSEKLHQTDQIYWLVTDLPFVFRTLLAGKKQMLLDSYALLQKVQEDGELWSSCSSDAIDDYRCFVLRVTGMLCQTDHPAALYLQSALNEPNGSQPCYDAEVLLRDSASTGGHVFLHCINKQEFSMHDKSKERFQWKVVCTACALSPLPSDCQLIALGYEDGVVRVYEYSRGALQATLKGHSQQVTHLLFVNRTSASLLITSSVDHAINVWNVKGAFRVAQLSHHDRSVSACVFDHVSANLISVGFDARICFWSLESFRLMGETSETKPISCIAQRPQSDEFVTGSWDCQLKIYAASTRKVVSSLVGHTCALKHVIWTAARIISCSMDGEIRIWSQREAGAFQTVGIISQPSVVNALAISECGNFLTTANIDKTLCVYRTRIGTQLYNVKLTINDDDDDDDDDDDKGLAGDRPHSILVTDDVIIVGTAYGSVHFYDRHTGRYSYSVKTDVKEASNTLLALPPHAAPKIVYVCQNSTVTVLQRTDSGKFCALTSFIAFPSQSTVPITAISCSLNVVAVTNAGGYVVVMESVEKEVNTCKKAATESNSRVCSESLREHDGQIGSCALSQSQRYLATVGHDCALVIYKVARKVSTFSLQVLHKQSKAHADWVTSVCWSNFDDSKLVTVAEDCSITVWKADEQSASTAWNTENDNWQLVRETTFKSPAPCTRVQLCADFIVASCRNGCVYAWNTDGLLVTDFACALPGTTFEGISMDCMIVTHSAELDNPSAGNRSGGTKNSAAPIQQKRRQLEDLRTRGTHNFFIAAVAGSRLGLYQPLRTRRLETLLGHSDRVVAVAMQQKSIISSSLDSTVREWSVPQLAAHSSSDMNTDNDELVGPVTCMQSFMCPTASDEQQQSRHCVVIAGTKLGYLLVATFVSEEFCGQVTLATHKLRLSKLNIAVNSLCWANFKVVSQADGSTNFVFTVYCGLNDSTISELLVTLNNSDQSFKISTKQSMKMDNPVTCLRMEDGGCYLVASDYAGYLLELEAGSLQTKRKFKCTEKSGWLFGFRPVATPHGEIRLAWSSDTIYVIGKKLGQTIGQISLESAEFKPTTASASQVTSFTDLIALENGGEAIQIFAAVNDGRVLPLKLSYAPNQCTLSWTGDPIRSDGDKAVNGLCSIRLAGDDVVVTGGNDCSIRLWNTAKAKKCGEVIGRSQIRALNITELEAQKYLTVGDDVGRIGVFSFI